MHTDVPDRTELDHMKTLHKMGYTRAVILQTKSLRKGLVQVTYHNNQPELEAAVPKEKAPNVWPAQSVIRPPGSLDQFGLSSCGATHTANSTCPLM